MTIPGAAICDPSVTTVALEESDQIFGGCLALAFADQGVTVLLQGQDSAALAKLQRTITERWCRATIASDDMFGDALIWTAASNESALSRLSKASNSRFAIEVLLVWTEGSADHTELATAVANLGPDRRVHAVVLPSMTEPANIDFAALAQISCLLISDAAKALPNQVITLHNCAADHAGRKSAYPEMTVCAPTVAPAR